MQNKNRKPNRLQNFDYSQNGMYFVTICTKNREHYFGEIENGKMVLNELGEIIKNVWGNLPKHYLNIKLDVCVVMPNHFHCIIEIINALNVGTGLKPVPTVKTKNHSLSEIIRGFKTFSARFINEKNKTPGIKIWQRSFHDRIIRNEIELNKIREYILTNPKMWERDRNNTENILM